MRPAEATIDGKGQKRNPVLMPVCRDPFADPDGGIVVGCAISDHNPKTCRSSPLSCQRGKAGYAEICRSVVHDRDQNVIGSDRSRRSVGNLIVLSHADFGIQASNTPLMALRISLFGANRASECINQWRRPPLFGFGMALLLCLAKFPVDGKWPPCMSVRPGSS